MDTNVNWNLYLELESAGVTDEDLMYLAANLPFSDGIVRDWPRYKITGEEVLMLASEVLKGEV